MGTIHSFSLEKLSDEDCWILLRERAFPTENWNEHPYLVVVGKEIAKKCRGIPLAAETLGGVLEGTKQERKWKDILNSQIWKLPQGGEDDILNSLRLSYHHLPSHLKQCFLYCSIFPKDYEFEKEKVVKLWMGEGFITSDVWQREIEDVGCDYFDDLLWRSFFQCEKNKYGRLVYKMHDLIHDLAQSLSEGECFRMEDEKLIDFSEKARYASRITHRANDLTMFEWFLKCKRLHTLLVFLEYQTNRVPTNLFQQMKFLHVLELSGNRMTELPYSIGNLKHLRYFALCSGVIERLPESVSSLYNLQTLDLSGCGRLIELPKDTRNLINLRHLTFPINQRMSSIPKGIGRLTCLRTLSKFIVGKDSGHEIGQLMILINLRGRLQISGLQNVANAKEVVWDNREYIDCLDLSWEGYQSVSIAEEILERFQPHPNLRILRINGYNGERFPSWIGQLPSLEELFIGSFPNLVEWSSGTEEKGGLPSLHTLEINDCMSLVALPRVFTYVRQLNLTNCNERILSSLSYFTSLFSLSISRIKNLQGIPSGSLKNLKALEKLSIWNLPQLASLLDGLKNLISLKYLRIGNCERLATLPKEGLPTTLQTLEIYRCPLLAEQCQKESGEYWPKISHIPHLSTDFPRLSSSIGASGFQ